MNWANALSLSRVPAVFIVAALLWLPYTGAATAAFVVFVVAALTDWLDGYVARKCGQVSDFGKIMDALTDKVLMVGVFATLIVAEVFPAWTLFIFLVIIARELLVTGLRAIAAAQGKVLAAERGGKIKTATQMICVVVALLGWALGVDFGKEASGGTLVQVGLWLFVLAGVLTVYSGMGYLMKLGELLGGQDKRGGEA